MTENQIIDDVKIGRDCSTVARMRRATIFFIIYAFLIKFATYLFSSTSLFNLTVA